MLPAVSTSRILVGGVIASLLSVSTLCRAAAPRALEAGALPPDHRLEPLKDLDGYFPFHPPKSLLEWTQRSDKLRHQLLVALGLWPMPSRHSLNPVIHGLVDQGDYTVEKVIIETLPGYFLTGSLYRPKGAHGRAPGVLSPHGHWANGRFYDNGLENTKNEIAAGAEKFENGGRSPLQARMVHLARMGCVVFHYDMIGYADNSQISYELAHRFAKQRPDMNTNEDWGLYSPQAEAHLQSIMGLQTWNSIRALDFLLSLPDVDGGRIGVTGASGGGTQTFLLGAVDPRPDVLFPAVMVSTAMQGGCTCENASLLRVGTGNVEFAALAAPKPYGMLGANDWTVEMSTKGFPELQEFFGMLGARDRVHLTQRNEFGHNYNAVGRAAMYHWFNTHLELGFAEPPEERDYPRLAAGELTVWDDAHPRPEGGDAFERELLRALHEDARGKIARRPDVARVGIEAILGRTLAEAGSAFEFEHTGGKHDRGTWYEMVGLLHNRTHDEALPMAFFHPVQNWNGKVVLWVHGDGKAGLYGDDGNPNADVMKLVDSGVSVAGIDLLFQGEFLKDGKPLESTRRVENPREAACYTFGYNHSLFVQRVHDILSAVAFIKNHELSPKAIVLVGAGGAGPLVAAARTQTANAVDAVAIDTGGFRFGNLLDLDDVNFVPGGAKYGDLPGMLDRAVPGPMLLAGEPEDSVARIRARYQSAHAAGNLTVPDDFGDALIPWILER